MAYEGAFGFPVSTNFNEDDLSPSIAQYLVAAGGAANDYSLQGGAAGTTTVSTWSILGWLGGFVVFLALLKWWGEGEKGLDDKPAHMRIGAYNFVVITFVAILGINIVKVLTTKYGTVAGLSNIVANA